MSFCLFLTVLTVFNCLIVLFVLLMLLAKLITLWLQKIEDDYIPESLLGQQQPRDSSNQMPHVTLLHE